MNVGIKHGLDLLAVNQKSAKMIQIKKKKFSNANRLVENSMKVIIRSQISKQNTKYSGKMTHSQDQSVMSDEAAFQTGESLHIALDVDQYKNLK